MEWKMKRIFFAIIFTLTATGLLNSAQPGQPPAVTAPQPAAQNQPQPGTGAQPGQAPAQTGQPATQPERTVIPPDPSTMKREYFRSIDLNTDYTLKLVGKINENQILSSSSFLVATYQEQNKVKSVANYGNDKKLALYVVDKRINMFFYYLTYEFTDDLVKTVVFHDTNDQKLWEIRYEYDQRKNITKTEIWRREIETGEMKLLFYNEYQYYAQGKMFRHSIFNSRKELEERTYYTPEGVKKRFERYRDGGTQVQYYVIHFFQNNNEIRREVYSSSDVLLEIIDMNAGAQAGAAVQQPAQPARPQPVQGAGGVNPQPAAAN